ncbi:MAG: hypothetical protein NTZ78_08145 [Candidatus Aureabacteria bacterium]|nr:hypothetical protein [Candidatus Auribacterota bacterium]
MEKLVCFVACSLFVFALALPGYAAQTEVSQPVDQVYPVGIGASKDMAYSDMAAADDWRCTNGMPITKFRWWGEYHPYRPDYSGPVDASDIPNPSYFILRLFKNDSSDPAFNKPGEKLYETQVFIEDAHQTFVATVDSHFWSPGPYYCHIFSYDVDVATMELAWWVEKDQIYWFEIQAVFEEVPIAHWAWLTTDPSNGANSQAVVSYDGGATWTKAEYGPGHPDEGKPLNLAFELGPQVVSVNPMTLNASIGTVMSITLNAPVARPFTVYVVGILPNGQMMSFIPAGRSGGGTAGGVMNFPCTPVSGLKPTAAGVPALTASTSALLFSREVALRAGKYIVKGAFFDPNTQIRSENDAFLLQSVEINVR